MKIKQYQVDAFTDRAFKGNPAAVCQLKFWPDDSLLQNIAMENNLSETAFFVRTKKIFSIRWFTPLTEVDLCGHATLAAAHVIFSELGYKNDRILFDSRSGELIVNKINNVIQMDFPSYDLKQIDAPEILVNALGIPPKEVLLSDDYIAVYDTEEMVVKIRPDNFLLSTLDSRGVAITAPGNQVDFVSRFFAPKLGVPEDPVTGSAHCALAPYWASRFGKKKLQAKQLSQRGGNLLCEVLGNRTLLSGNAVTVMETKIRL
ncbi:PhzF family phenazine biosynthesis protein [Acidithiobacillus sp. AMEEHan]|uniref:PhzF family phenazine biosynthesis protein n=1 Tax=Acidithiobacillus sp. AMEEHan TaxID=2994951 RepID=UPI0027E52763|nr:PhzF family phenazine biosynthesis protein [Acidithiobacillus sp. AMEEHan]